MRSISVWDMPTRIFHWLLVACVASAYLTGSARPHGLQYAIHVASGYAVALLLVFRLLWGFVGGEHARFGGFVAGWKAVKSHLQGLLRLAPARVLGHNAIGGWVIVVILATLLLIVLTGLLAQGVPGGAGPLSGVLPKALVKSVGSSHELLGSFIIYLAALHVAGVLVESVLLRENLAGAMVTGRKAAENAADRDARPAPRWRAALVLLLVALLATGMVGATQLPGPGGPPQQIGKG
jgi:cytochrome b